MDLSLNPNFRIISFGQYFSLLHEHGDQIQARSAGSVMHKSVDEPRGTGKTALRLQPDREAQC